MHDTRLEAGVAYDHIYAPIFLVLAGMLVVGFIANALVKPVDEKYFMTDKELAAEHKLAHDKSLVISKGQADSNNEAASASHPLLTSVAWALVLIPIGYGIWSTIQKASVLFH
jgi:hypothetical protein